MIEFILKLILRRYYPGDHLFIAADPGDCDFTSHRFYNFTLLSGKIFKAMNFEISHFVRDDNQLFIYLGGVGWRLHRQHTPPKIIALKTPSFRL